MPSSKGSSQPRDQIRSSAMQFDSLPFVSSRKPKNTRVDSLSLLQGIFSTQESNRGLLHYRQILYQLGYQGSPGLLHIIPKISFYQLKKLKYREANNCSGSHTTQLNISFKISFQVLYLHGKYSQLLHLADKKKKKKKFSKKIKTFYFLEN